MATKPFIDPNAPRGGRQVEIYGPNGEVQNAQFYRREGEEKSELDRFLDQGYSRTKPSDSPAVQDNQAVSMSVEQAKVLLPYLTKLDPVRGEKLIQAYIEGYNETGKPEFALANMRAIPEYSEMFQGIKRADGSLRMNEATYLSNKEAVIIHLNEAGLGGYAATKIDALFPTLLEGNVNPGEFKSRLDAVRKGLTNLDATLRESVGNQYQLYFEQELGEPVTVNDEVLLAIAIDPEVTSDILTERLKVANIGARFVLATGDELTADQASMFMSGSRTPEQTSQLFETAAARALTASRLSRRFKRGGEYTAVQLAQAEVTKDFETQQELSRISAQAASESAVELGARKTREGAVTGLTEA